MVVFRYHWDDFYLLQSSVSSSEKRYSWDCLFNSVRHYFLSDDSWIWLFNPSCTKKVQEKYQDIFNHYPELEENVELFKENATAVDKLNQLYLYREAIFNTEYGRFVNPIFLNEIQALGVRIKWVRNGKVRSKNLFLLSREGEKEFEFDLGMVTPVKYEQLILLLHAVLDVKPELEFFNEVED